MPENTKSSPLILALENPHCAKRRIRIAWHLETQPLSFLLSRRICSPFFLACCMRKEEDGHLKEERRIICPHNKGLAYFFLPSRGLHILRAFIVWPEGKSSWVSKRHFMRRLVSLNSFTRHYQCGILGYDGNIDNFYRLASSEDGAGHVFHRMRESVMGPEYYLYDLNASIEVHVTL